MSRRTEKVGELLRRELAQILILGELRDPRLGAAHNISITAVHVSGDLGHARVFFDLLGDPTARARAGKALNSSAGRIRALLGERVQMRRTPELHFEWDESIERGRRMEAIFEELQDAPAPGEGEGDDSAGVSTQASEITASDEN
jgi:ribosome-binding factor A